MLFSELKVSAAAGAFIFFADGLLAAGAFIFFADKENEAKEITARVVAKKVARK